MDSPDTVIEDLVNELLAAVKDATSELSEKTFYVFSVSNLDNISDVGGFPIAGVIFEGLFPSSANNPSTAKPSTSSAVYTRARFSVVVGDRYNFVQPAHGVDDSKNDLTLLLTKITRRVLGIQTAGVTSRPWRFLQTVPVDTRVSGAIMYLQLWEQDLVIRSQNR